HLAVQRDLDVDLIVRAIDAGTIVDKVGVDAPAMLGELNATGLGNAKVGAFADDLCPDFIPTDAERIVGSIADVGITLRRSLDVGSDAAEPQKVNRRFQDGIDERDRIERASFYSQRFARLRAQRDRFLGARENPTAFGDESAVVIVPARARELE